MRYKQIATIGAVLIATLVLLAAFMYYFNQGISNCPKGTFPCQNNTKCITHRNMCNNMKDCPGGEDENDCFDSYNNFWESLFPNWTTCLNDSDNEIQDYINCKYFNCTLICEKFIGPKIPEIFAKKNILTMTFRTSSLPILKEDFFRDYPNLRNELYLMGNQIQYLEHGVFSNQKYLLWLGLSDNKIEKLTEGHFIGLHSLETLVIENNKIHTLDLRDLRNSASLKVLELSRNLLTLSNLSIPHLPVLRELNLNENQLELITADFFAGLPALEELNLEYNLIQKISPFAFQNLHRLTVLNLMNNRITRIPLGLFNPVQSLSSLRTN
ncbi:relaxin receptor 1 isoform X2 [Nasonia vitripennis]|uniref:Uncharacterized protein n=1 Tax=Nasonia vitripennis TaxID=7425 RepID=A0A7M7Q9T3_NASVI|nr:relaxin receptor 1 isoform X2 [Nasonia vitripennis]